MKTCGKVDTRISVYKKETELVNILTYDVRKGKFDVR